MSAERTKLRAYSRRSDLFNSKRGRAIAENLTAYLFLSPAILLIFLFGIFPVAFAFFVSLHRWRRFPESYVGFENYERALGNFSYALFLWLAIIATAFAFSLLRKLWTQRETDKTAIWYIIPGFFNTAAILAFTNWLFILLPVILDIPQRLRGQAVNREIFVGELISSFTFPEVLPATYIMHGFVAAAAVVMAVFVWRLRSPNSASNLLRATLSLTLIALAFLIGQLTLDAMNLAITEAREAGEELPVWSQVILISLGFAMIISAYFLWSRAHKQFENRRMLLYFAVAFLLMFGGFLFIIHLPTMLSTADDDMLQGFNVTVMYSLGTVPVQLGIGMALAYLLFQNIRGKVFFRIVYFMPYIMPFVATSIVFRILFSNRAESPVNRFIGLLGVDPQKWLLEPTGVFHLAAPDLPSFLAGPGLALVVIMIYGTWTYIGYDAVVFLAGLGNIQPELYEAARIDGANRWQEFRHITFPLLSPTTFFLSLIAIIGTFQAFTQIWIMRTPAASRAVDTVGVYIFEAVSSNNRLGYGSAMAFVLFAVILALTLIQNRVLGRKVFYG